MGFSDTDDMAPAQTLQLTKEDLVAGSASVLKFVKFQRVTGLSVRHVFVLFRPLPLFDGPWSEPSFALTVPPSRVHKRNTYKS